mgnify:CR=1 FL=1
MIHSKKSFFLWRGFFFFFDFSFWKKKPKKEQSIKSTKEKWDKDALLIRLLSFFTFLFFRERLSISLNLFFFFLFYLFFLIKPFSPLSPLPFFLFSLVFSIVWFGKGILNPYQDSMNKLWIDVVFFFSFFLFSFWFLLKLKPPPLPILFLSKKESTNDQERFKTTTKI